jgi:hypothetical protein
LVVGNKKVTIRVGRDGEEFDTFVFVNCADRIVIEAHKSE